LLKASKTRVPDDPLVLPALDARSVGEAAEEAVLSLSAPRDGAFMALYGYVVVDEPAVHLMPLHFMPRSSRRTVVPAELHSLAVAAKLEYARSRWIDEIVDSGCTESLLAAHALHGKLLDAILARYSEVLRDKAPEFLKTLVGLYAHHGMSLAIDGSRPRRQPGSLSEEEYYAQVQARNGSFRASVDAVLLLAGASENLLERARQAWRLWVLGAQLYDDALDVEEDFESESVTWTVDKTLAGLGERTEGSRRPDRDTFYEAALVGGAVVETLDRAESCFRSAAGLADREFPSWAALQRACITQTSRLRTDFVTVADKIARR